MANFPVPNWAQAQLASAAGLAMTAPAVVIDNEISITFMDLVTRDAFIVRKKDGRVTVDKNNGKEKGNGRKRSGPADGNEGFL